VKESKGTVLVVDDEREHADGIVESLKRLPLRALAVYEGDDAVEILRHQQIDVVVTDLKLRTQTNGLVVLDEARRQDPNTKVILITAYATIDTCKEALRRGAYDYLVKPIDVDQLRTLVHQAMQEVSLARSRRAPDSEGEKSAFVFDGVVGLSPAMEHVIEVARRVAATQISVLIEGESGTGKELLARAIHDNSPRRRKAFQPVNCAGLAETLLESELFGHTKGSFTGAMADRKGLFELADGGTLFLDEIGELPVSLQIKLLRFLQDGEIRRLGDTETRRVDVRLVAATARDLEAEVSAGRFREDLFYRLNVIRLHVPPLRERPADIPFLSRHFLAHYCAKHGKAGMTLSPEALAALGSHDWRGNVRELKNLMERCSLLGGDREISREGLMAVWKTSGGAGRAQDAAPSYGIRISVSPERPDLKSAVRDLERQLIRMALERSGGSRPKAAELLGISHPALLYKAKEYGILGS